MPTQPEIRSCGPRLPRFARNEFSSFNRSSIPLPHAFHQGPRTANRADLQPPNLVIFLQGSSAAGAAELRSMDLTITQGDLIAQVRFLELASRAGPGPSTRCPCQKDRRRSTPGGCGQVVRHQPSKLIFTGPNPVTRSFYPGWRSVDRSSGLVAQRSERAAHNRQVAGFPLRP
jgi:hypothetical protein